MLQAQTVTVFGGSGFLGRYVVKLLCEKDYRVKIVSSNPEYCSFLKPAGKVGQLSCIYGDICNTATIDNALQHTDIVINLVGIMHPHGQRTFSNVHAKGPEFIAKAAAHYNISRLIHVSALGVDKPTGSLYARSKLNGEKAILNAYPTATILRPSIIFGTEDKFFNRFADMAHFSPILPLIGGGHSKMQPVYVMDVANAILACINNRSTEGKIYELGGPNIYSFKELIQFILTSIGKKRLLLPLPFALASIVGFLMENLPNPSLTRDQVKLLKTDNVVGKDMLGFKNLGIIPQPLEAIIPHYLNRISRY